MPLLQKTAVGVLDSQGSQDGELRSFRTSVGLSTKS